jgi:polyhydroxyalkanoate synthesis regulator phasin
MAKKDDKKKKSDAPPDLGEAVRAAFERTFQAYTESGERTRSVLDEMASAASRIRQSLQDSGGADDVAGLRREVEALSKRVAALEEAAAKKPATRRAPARKTGTGTARKSSTSTTRRRTSSS